MILIHCETSDHTSKTCRLLCNVRFLDALSTERSYAGGVSILNSLKKIAFDGAPNIDRPFCIATYIHLIH